MSDSIRENVSDCSGKNPKSKKYSVGKSNFNQWEELLKDYFEKQGYDAEFKEKVLALAK